MSRYGQFRRQQEALQSGRRDRPVTVQQRASTESVDSGGFPTDNADGWTTLQDPEWMHRHDLGGMEGLVSQQQSAPIDTIWTMGYRSDMDPEVIDVPKLRRLVYQGRIYDIVTAAVIGRQEGIELMTLAASGVAA